jgi:ubiquinol-cytochrome c reductase iron-sulfur subunit
MLETEPARHRGSDYLLAGDLMPPKSDISADKSRREFLFVATASMTAVGAIATAWPFIDSLNPAADTIAAGAPVDVNISRIQPGQQITVLWRSRPIFILNRTPAALKELQQSDAISLLADPESSIHQQPDYARNWHRSIKPQYLVVVGICTHLGCVPQLWATPGGGLGANWPGGFFCPCHGSKYDLAARVFKGVPAPYNLPVPPHRFVSDQIIRVGENPPGSDFDLRSVVQI